MSMNDQVLSDEIGDILAQVKFINLFLLLIYKGCY